MKMRRVIAASVIALASMGVNTAIAAPISASGQGWCESGLTCNGVSGIHNTFAGQENTLFRDWFTFAIPSLGTITGATINIWNDGGNHTSESDSIYNLHAATSITYAGLAAGGSLGSVSLVTADTGTSGYVSITLNALGLADLFAAEGGNFTFGGVVSPITISGFDDPSIFGFTGGTPVAQLTLSTTAVPEPFTFSLVGTGLAGAVAMRRRRRRRP